MPNVKIDLKVVLLGMECGGKTSLVERFIYDRFTSFIPYQNTIGAAYVAKKVEVDGHVINMGIWDTAGSERYEAMSRIYYRNAKAAIVCYDLTNAMSFKKANFWVSELRKCEEECKLYLCGTKYDLIQDDRSKRAVDYHTVTDYADEIKAFYIETSSKTSQGVSELFTQIARDYVMSLPASAGGYNSLQAEDAGVGKFAVDVTPVLTRTKLKCCSS